jgi:hypothetical protein
MKAQLAGQSREFALAFHGGQYVNPLLGFDSDRGRSSLAGIVHPFPGTKPGLCGC